MNTALLLLIFHSVIIHGCGISNQTPDPKAKKIVESFYKWYINDAYVNNPGYYQTPPFKKLEKGKYVFDKFELRKRLNQIKELSESYKITLLEKLEICNHEMFKRTWEYEPEPQFNIQQCDYLWYDNWVGGQGENINGFRIVNGTQIGSNVNFNVEILINDKVFTKSIVTLEMTEGNYQISNIELIWD